MFSFVVRVRDRVRIKVSVRDRFKMRVRVSVRTSVVRPLLLLASPFAPGAAHVSTQLVSN